MSPAVDPIASFLIGTVPVYGDAILAPMDGFSDLPYRSLCREFGSSLSYTPFVNAMEILARQPRALRLLDFLPAERPVVFQLFDSDEERLLKAAQSVLDLQPDILDINMGCSVRSVAGRGAGAGLLRDPRKVARIISSLSRALPVPVTAKIRLGWDDRSHNYLEVARAVADHGGSLIAVHARTRQQRYSGRADWDAIAAVKAAVSIPVIGNGDVQRAEDIQRMRQHTSCDGVMIGRGAIGNPWIFQQRERHQVPSAEIVATIRRHAQAMVSYYGERDGLVLFRKHLVRYLQSLTVAEETRAAMLSTTSLAAFEEHLSRQERLQGSPSRLTRGRPPR
ncbi:MAG: tRNA dihydrouridine synthase DusB [Chloroflexi bacterium]|nr:tRNA dihydrouridine synthase DusB [Chloroflexota bacterium]